MIDTLQQNANFFMHDMRIPFCEMQNRCVQLHKDQLEKIKKVTNLNDSSKDTILGEINKLLEESDQLFYAPFESLTNFWSQVKNCFHEFVDFLVTGRYIINSKSEKIRDFFEGIKNMFEEVLKSQNIQLNYSFDGPDDFTSDFIKIQRILQNLFFNARSATISSKAESKVINFSVSKNPDIPNHLQITISNPGSINHKLGDIFADGVTSSGDPNKGHGLHIVKTLTEALGGTITLNTEDNRVEFVLTIPDRSKPK